MKTHQKIDERSLALAEAVVAKIEADPERAGLDRARRVCRRWYAREKAPAYREWMEILNRPWDEVKGKLLDRSEEGQRLRQSTPFCGILTPRERWRIYGSFKNDAT